jgi:hypothetical protein
VNYDPSVRLPPSAAVGALYDGMLQSALRQFFERATVDAEPAAMPSADSLLAIEPSANPAALTIRWFGTRYTLRVPGRWVFTAHEVRLARAIGAVLAARYRAILNPQIIAERSDLFQGLIEDRYVGSFLDHRPYEVESRAARADLIASVIELLRGAALSSYENRVISTGVLLLNSHEDPCRPAAAVNAAAPAYSQSLTSIKSFYRLADGVSTLFLANAEGRLLDIIDVERWSHAAGERKRLPVATANRYGAHARATQRHGHVCAILSPSRDIKIFAEGVEVFAFRGAQWHLLDLQAKYRVWSEAVGNEALALRLFQTALDLSDMREGALFVVARDPQNVAALVAPGDRLDLPVASPSAPDMPSRRDLLHLLEGRSATDLDPSVLAALGSLDGATVITCDGRLLAAGAILRHLPVDDLANGGGIVEGARTSAALSASRLGPVLKVSEDGIITFFDGERVWDI